MTSEPRSTADQPALELRPIGRTFQMPGHYVWCSSPIWGDDGRVHLFYSRWTKDKGMAGWINGSEIGHAVADGPEEEFRHREVVLAPRPGFWDGTTCHNPLIKRVGDRFFLFYLGNSNGRTDTKRIGVAISDSLDGPWQRPDQPCLLPGQPGAWDDHCTTNPAFVEGDDGKYWLFYKSWNTAEYESQQGKIRGNRKYGLAKADRPEGPYRKITNDPVIDFSGRPNNAQLEDAYVWYEDGRYHLIARDMGFHNHEYGLLLSSSDGLEWSGPRVAYLELSAYVDEPPAPRHLTRYGRLERPMLLHDHRSGRPRYLFGGSQGGRFETATTFVFEIVSAAL